MRPLLALPVLLLPVLFLAGTGVIAAQPRPEPETVIRNPPEPPSRPSDLTPEPPANPLDGPPPIPPERPPELTSTPQTPASEPGQAAGAAPAPSLPANAPPPPPRPPELSGGAPLSLTIHTHDIPVPPERPPELTDRTAPGTASGPLPSAPMPPVRPAELSEDAVLARILAAPEDSACLRSLDSLGVKYEKLPPIVNGQCTVAHPLNVTAIGSGVGMNSISLTADQMVVCGVAEGLGRWAKEAEAAAEKELGDKLKGLTLGGGYHCRGQNNVGEAKLSEHAFANAIDIMGFTFAKHAPIDVSFLPAGSKEAAFLDSVRASACAHFRTVLGPGSNESHANHLHFDQRERAGGHRICELGPAQAATSSQSAGAAP